MATVLQDGRDASPLVDFFSWPLKGGGSQLGSQCMSSALAQKLCAPRDEGKTLVESRVVEELRVADPDKASEPVAASPTTSTGWVSWFSQKAQLVKRVVTCYREGDLTLREIGQLVFSRQSELRGLLSDYRSFKAQRAQGPTTHTLERDEVEKRAQDLFERSSTLTPRERREFEGLLQRLHERECTQRQGIYRDTDTIVDALRGRGSLLTETRENVEKAVLAELMIIRGYQREDQLTLNDYSVVELAVSKILLIGMDSRASEPQQVAFLAAMHSEHNRLMTKDKCFTGEDFLRVKVEQLDFLFKGLNHFKWTLTFVEDEGKKTPEHRRTIDTMREMVEQEPLSRFKDQIVLLDYEEDLQEERALYRDEALASASPDEFAQKSVKGGAIHTGLRYLAQVSGGDKAYKTPKADVILYTDCDTSIHLGNSGILLNQIYNCGQDVAIGSRRIKGSHVIGKSAERHLQSFLFNFLVRSLLNVQLTDTQVGAKAIRPGVIQAVHSGFSEVSMAFDPEFFRLAKEKDFKVGEDGIVWTDSAIESQSAGQGMNMFQGLMRIAQGLHRKGAVVVEEPSTPRSFESTAQALSQEGKLFESLVSLASNPKWHTVIEEAQKFYSLLSPKEFRLFVNELSSFACRLANNEVRPEDIQTLIGSFLQVAENLRESDALAFVMHEFPEIFDCIELIQKDPQYAQVIVPMLFGTGVATKLLTKSHHTSYFPFAASAPERSECFTKWVREGARVEEAPKTERETLEVNWERIEAGKGQLREINSELVQRGERLKIGVVLQFDMDTTPRAYIERVMGQKINELKEHFGEFTNVDWEFLVVDARKERTSGVEEVFEEVFRERCSGNVSGRLIAQEDPNGKARAIRFGLSEGARDNDIVSFIDFSDKIPILEMGNLVANAYRTKESGQEAVAIGSRRLEESQVVNKPVTFLMRSLGLNLTVKAMFPLLFNVYDTQTGFKVFTKDAWTRIAGQGLVSESLAFDIEILQQAARLGLPIAECPVDFFDNSQNREGEIGETMIGGMFDDILAIRARLSDSPLRPFEEGEARLLAGGAENIVYQLPNGSLIKIPHEVFDTDFISVVKNFLLKDQKQMAVGDQKDKLITSQFINRLLTSPRISKYIPLLRSWKDLNILVMKVITSIENKNYKSMGYETAARLGKDLVIPFRFVTEPFTCKIDGQERTFTADDHVKQSSMTREVFKDQFLQILSSEEQPQEKVAAIKGHIDQGLRLFRDLWHRGLFDLDTNFMCDTGYYTDSMGHRRLMVLDPGELIDDLSLIDIGLARSQVDKRYDFIEMGIFLEKLPEDARTEVLEYYKQKMGEFLDYVEEDLERPEGDRVFARDQREAGGGVEQFRVTLDPALTLPDAKETGVTAGQRKRKALELSRSGYQMPYAEKHEAPKQPGRESLPQFYHLVPEAQPYPTEAHPSEMRRETAIGCIGPTFEALPDILDTRESALVVLDAGTATRSSLLKYAEHGSSKGAIKVQGTPLYQSTAASMRPLLESLPEDYVVMTSSDDLMELDEAAVQQVRGYFQGEEAPGVFWLDLPNGGKTLMPLTARTTYEFMKSHAQLPERAEQFLSQVPFTKGFARDGRVQMAFDAAVHAMDHWQSRPTSPQAAKESGAMPQIPGVTRLADMYGQFLVYNATEQTGGMKTPFLLVFKKAFLKDFQKEVLPLLPSYTFTHITWESILLRGMKTDKQMWMAQGRPSQLSPKEWERVWVKIQELKAKHNISTDHPTQTEARVFKGSWQNFDDPHSLYRYTVQAYEQKRENVFQSGLLKCVSDRELAGSFPQVRSSIPGNLALVNSRLEGTVQLAPHSKKPGTTAECLFYNVHLPSDRHLVDVPSNHLVVGIGSEIYSITMGPMTKDELKQQMVYKYDPDGKPQEFMPYGQFIKKFRQ